MLIELINTNLEHAEVLVEFNKGIIDYNKGVKKRLSTADVISFAKSFEKLVVTYMHKRGYNSSSELNIFEKEKLEREHLRLWNLKNNKE